MKEQTSTPKQASRQLRFLYQDPGMLEAIASESEKPKKTQSLPSRGYADSYIPDLMVDYREGKDLPFAWISYNFHKNFPLVIWGLKLLSNNELFDLPQAGLIAVPLHEAFSWAYTHFILEDDIPKINGETPLVPISLTREVLHYAAALA